MHIPIVPLVVAFTPNYFIPAVTCLASVLKHTEVTKRFHVICLLTEDLPERQKRKLQGLDAEERIKYSFLNLKNRLTGVYVDERYTVAASFRLLLPSLLPEYDKVLYIDCDMIVRNDLAALYFDTDLGDNYMAAVFEASLPFQHRHLQDIGCRPGTYFNSGFLLMNLAKLRDDGMEAKFIEALKTDYLEFPDQDVLNMLCKGKVLGLPPYYNSIRTYFLPQYKEFFLHYYSEEEWGRVQEHGNIHYTGGKPWNGYTVAFEQWWRQYLALPEKIRKGEERYKRMYVFYCFYRFPLIRRSFDMLRAFYRRFK